MAVIPDGDGSLAVCSYREPGSRAEMTAQPAWVLVVDDDATDALLLFRLLERMGHQATVAGTGGSALELLRNEPFDLVLLDLLLPDVDGYAVLEAMKADGRLRHLPVIMISGLDELEAVVRCVALGADDYLDKPVDPLLLRARVDSCLMKKRLREREEDYQDVVGHLLRAATAGAGGAFDTNSLEPVRRRVDPLGQLARVMSDMATQMAELRAAGPDGTEPQRDGATSRQDGSDVSTG